jgi:hypothetical protein
MSIIPTRNRSTGVPCRTVKPAVDIKRQGFISLRPAMKKEKLSITFDCKHTQSPIFGRMIQLQTFVFELMGRDTLPKRFSLITTPKYAKHLKTKQTSQVKNKHRKLFVDVVCLCIVVFSASGKEGLSLHLHLRVVNLLRDPSRNVDRCRSYYPVTRRAF